MSLRRVLNASASPSGLNFDREQHVLNIVHQIIETTPELKNNDSMPTFLKLALSEFLDQDFSIHRSVKAIQNEALMIIGLVGAIKDSMADETKKDSIRWQSIYKIILAKNYLTHHAFSNLSGTLPYLIANHPDFLGKHFSQFDLNTWFGFLNFVDKEDNIGFDDITPMESRLLFVASTMHDMDELTQKYKCHAAVPDDVRNKIGTFTDTIDIMREADFIPHAAIFAVWQTQLQNFLDGKVMDAKVTALHDRRAP